MIKPGQRVTCLHATASQYSGYGGNPEMIFSPGMVGVVHCLAPKVRIIPVGRRAPGQDGKSEFAVVDYDCPINGRQRVGLNLCNVDHVS